MHTYCEKELQAKGNFACNSFSLRTRINYESIIIMRVLKIKSKKKIDIFAGGCN